MKTAQQLFLSKFESLGYRRGLALRASSAGSHWYEREPATSEIRQYALVTYKSRIMAYGVDVGIEHEPARRRAYSARNVIEKYLHPLTLSTSVRFLDNPSWMVFDLGRALNWPLFAIPNPLNASQWELQFADLLSLLEARIWAIDEPEKLLRVLIQDESPFSWSGTSGVLRTAQIIALSKTLEADLGPIRTQVLSRSLDIQSQIYGGATVEQVVDDFIASI